MTKFGICMEGNETALRDAIAQALQVKDHAPVFVEIGTAAGETTRGIAEVCKDYGASPHIYTFDIPDGWSLNVQAVTDLCEQHNNITALVTLDGARGYLEENWAVPITFAFIDGCHGKDCVMKDFRAVERFCVPGSVVVFHDTSPTCQSIHMQPHCGTPIRVREALFELGLIPGTRPGWKTVKETRAPHGILVVERV